MTWCVNCSPKNCCSPKNWEMEFGSRVLMFQASCCFAELWQDTKRLMRRSSKPEPWLSCLASRAFPTKALMEALHGLRCWDTGPLPEAVSPWERSRCRTCCWMVCASSPSSGKDGQLPVNDQQFGQLLDRLWRVGRMAEGQFQPPNRQGATGDVGSYHYFPTFDQPPWYRVWTWLSILLHGFQQHGVLIMQPPKVQSCLLHQCPVEWTKVLPRFP